MATIIVTLPAFFESSYRWYAENRVSWVGIVTAAWMTPLAGTTISGLLLRTIGTFVGAISSLVLYYIGGAGNVIAILVLFPFFMFGFVLVLRREPLKIQLHLLTIITFILITGYDLQILKGGIALADSTGQRYMPIYLLAPYRFLVVFIGVCTSTLFTLFPHPHTTRSLLRRNIAKHLFTLSSFFGLINEKLLIDRSNFSTGGLDKESFKLQKRIVRLLNEERAGLQSVQYEFSLRGSFPRKTYTALVNSLSVISTLYQLIYYAERGLSDYWQDQVYRAQSSPEGVRWRQQVVTYENNMALSLLIKIPLPSAVPNFQNARDDYRKQLYNSPGYVMPNINDPGFTNIAAVIVSGGMAATELSVIAYLVKDLVGSREEMAWTEAGIKKQRRESIRK